MMARPINKPGFKPSLSSIAIYITHKQCSLSKIKIHPGKITMKKDPMYGISSIHIIAINENKSFEQL